MPEHSISSSAPISILPRELLDKIVADVAGDGYKIENCARSQFFFTDKGSHQSPMDRFTAYMTSRDNLLAMMLSCKTLLPSAGRILYGYVVISTHHQLVTVLRSVLHRPATWKTIRHLEIACDLDYMGPPRLNNGRIDNRVMAFTCLIHSTRPDSFPWIERLRSVWNEFIGTLSNPERCINLLLLALMYLSPRLKTVYLAVCERDPGPDQPVGSRFMAQVGEFSQSHNLCPSLQHVYLTIGRMTMSQDVTPSLRIQAYQPLLSLGQVTKVTIFRAALSVASGTRTFTAVAPTPLQRIKELTLDTINSPSGTHARLLAISHLLEQTKTLHTLQIRLGRVDRSWDYVPIDISKHWEDVLHSIPSRNSLRHLDLCRSPDYSLRATGRSPGLLKCLSDFQNLSFLRIPIDALFGETKLSWFDRTTPLRSPGTRYFYAISMEKPMAVPSFPPQLRRLILITKGYNPVNQPCETFDVSQWSKPVEDPESVLYNPKVGVEVVRVLRGNAPWLRRVDICAERKSFCTRHGD